MKADILQILHEEAMTQYNPESKDERVVYSDEFDTVANQIISLSNNHLIDFTVWYSGMDRDKVEKAYKRFKEETSK